MLRFDMIIFGTGIGLTLLEAGLQNHLKCALIEPGKFGGTCLTRGCIPSKVLTSAADALTDIRRMSAVGITAQVRHLDADKVFDRMWQQIDQSKDIESGLDHVDQLTVYKGHGEFTGIKTVRVAYRDGSFSEEMTADRIVFAVGARPFVPNIKGLEQAGYLTYETFFGQRNPDRTWRRTAILGAGAIGAEFAYIFSELFGSQVTLIEAKDRILPLEDSRISRFVERSYESNGIRAVTNTEVEQVRTDGTEKILTLKNLRSGSMEELRCDGIFVATGIRSNADRAKATFSGIHLDDKGWVITDDHLRTNVPGIWAPGDINGKFQFRHKANYEGEICVHNIFNPSADPKRVSYNSVPWAIFTHPQVAHVGATLEQALKNRKGVYMGIKHYSSIAKGFAMGYEAGSPDDGFVMLIADADYRILGAHIVGYEAAALIQPYVYLMNAGCTCILPKRRVFQHNTDQSRKYDEMGRLRPIAESMVIHPALSELTAWVVSEMKWVESYNPGP